MSSPEEIGWPEPRERGAGTPRPWDERLSEAACLGFALWTLCCHAVVAVRGSLLAVLVLFAGVVGLGGLCWRLGLRPFGGPRRDPAPEAAPRGGELENGPRLPRGAVVSSAWWLRGLFAGAFGVAIVWWMHAGDMIVVWILVGVALLVGALLALRFEGVDPAAPVGGRHRGRALLALALASSLVALIAHRPDADDALYVNFAVVAADEPGAALFVADTVHGVARMPLHIPIYRLHSYELLNGALSLLSGIPAIYCFHWIAAAVAAFFLPLAWAPLLRRLMPATWLPAVATLLVVLLAVGETHRWFGNFALVRIWQGKSIFLFIAMPWIYVQALRFMTRPSRWAWLRLAAAQVAALGLSSTAVWAAPVGAFLALASAATPSRRGLARFGFGALTSAYVLGAGLLMRGGMVGGPSPTREFGPGELLARALTRTLGEGTLLLIGMAALGVAWCLAPAGLARRFCTVVPLGVWLVLLNPFGASWVMSNVTGRSYWRVLWAVPLPLLLVLVLLAPLHVARRTGVAHGDWRGGAGRSALALLLVAAFVAWVPAYHGLGESNGVELRPPSLKVPPAYAWARMLDEAFEPGVQVAAPPVVSTWSPTFHRPVHPLIVRRYLNRQRSFLAARFGPGDLVRRERLARLLAHPAAPRAPEILHRALDSYRDLQGIFLPIQSGSAQLGPVLESRDFRLSRRTRELEIWSRPPEATDTGARPLTPDGPR